MTLECFPPQPSMQESQKDRATWSKSPPPTMPSVFILPSPQEQASLQTFHSGDARIPYQSLVCTFFFFKPSNFEPDFAGSSLRRSRELGKSHMGPRRASLSPLLVYVSLGPSHSFWQKNWGETVIELLCSVCRILSLPSLKAN